MKDEHCHLAIDRGLSLGAEFVETRIHKVSTESLVYKNGELQPISQYVEEGLGIRILVDGTLGFCAINTLSETAITEIVEKLYKITSASHKINKNEINFADENSVDIEYQVSEKTKWQDIPLKTKTEYLDELDVSIRERDKIKFAARLIELDRRVDEKTYITSDGTSVKSKIPRVGVFYFLTGVEGANSIQRFNHRGGSGGWEILADQKVNEVLTEDANAMEKVLLHGKKAPDKKLDLIVGGEIAGIIAHESVGHPSETDRILGREAAQAGESYMTVKSLEKQIGSEEVNVSDDPTLPSSYGYYLYDDEGTKAKKRNIVTQGMITEFLHNRDTAARFEISSNGSSRAMSYSVEPIIRMANTFFEPGNYDFEEMLEGIKEGVYMKSFMEWNIDDRRVNQRYTGMEAYMIENGEITYPIKSPILEITTQDLLQALVARGKNLDFWAATCGKGDPMQGAPVWTGGPKLKFSNIRMRGR